MDFVALLNRYCFEVILGDNPGARKKLAASGLEPLHYSSRWALSTSFSTTRGVDGPARTMAAQRRLSNSMDSKACDKRLVAWDILRAEDLY